jgi:formylglycine-generating enzyme required for sulfatase activity
VRVLVGVAPERRDEAAEALGFTRVRPTEREARSGPTEASRSAAPRTVDSLVEQAPSDARMTYWRANSIVHASDEPEASRTTGTPPVVEDDAEPLFDRSASVLRVPRTPPLARWSRLWPAVWKRVRVEAVAVEIDARAILERWSRGEFVHELPRAKRGVWPERLVVVLDRDRRLTPFWDDQEDLCVRLQRACGQTALVPWVIDAHAWSSSRLRGTDALDGLDVDATTPVLVLGDLGFYADEATSRAWRRAALRLRRQGVAVGAVVPVPRAWWRRDAARAWNAVAWECARGPSPRSETERANRAAALLRLVSPAAIVQPGLLRALRRLLLAREADAVTEFDVWHHPEVRASGAAGVSLLPEFVAARRREFAALSESDPELVRRVSALVGSWHAALPRELLHAETLAWHAEIAPERAAPPGDLDRALTHWRRLERTLRDGEEDTALGGALRRYARAHLHAMNQGVFDELPWMRSLLWEVRAEGDPMPANFDPREFAGRGRKRRRERAWALHQVGGSLVLHRANDARWPSARKDAGSPLGSVVARAPEALVTYDGEAQGTLLALREGAVVSLRGGGLTVSTDRSRVTLAAAVEEPWMSASGRDECGLWAEWELVGVKHRMRWIPGGTFWMGSPEGEAGRFEDEGPRHEVELASGYWMGETPVTQTLWEAVMGSNPSRFQSPDRPVERVSWDDCQEFLTAVNRRVKGLELRLPTEAEWECACRGGTTTATWAGDLTLVGANHAPELDAIAWYGGNSGVGFELANGEESSTWREKQYAHTRAGTHAVRDKAANPYGLYDMLGDVYEWCADGRRTYANVRVQDPYGPVDGTLRVYRGGSWLSYARYVRASLRLADSRSYRGGHLGLRVVRGQVLRTSPVESRSPRSGAEVAEGSGRLPDEAAARDATTPTAHRRR